VGSTLTEPAFLAPELGAITLGAGAAVVALVGERADWLRRLIGRIDRALRWWYGVHGLSDRHDCLLRIALARTTETTRLPDGSEVPPGAAVIDLHLWNERICLLPAFCQGFSRGVALRQHMRLSLAELARLLADETLLQNVVAIRAQAALVPERRIGMLLRVAAAFGFEPAANAAPQSSRRPLISRFCHDLFGFALAWAFNPRALRRNGWRRQRCVLWMSRTALLSAYGHSAKRPEASVRCSRRGGACLDRPAYPDQAQLRPRRAPRQAEERFLDLLSA